MRHIVGRYAPYLPECAEGVYLEVRKTPIMRSRHSQGCTADAWPKMIKHLEQASRRIQASRHLMQEHALVEDPEYLRLVARLSEALEVTEAARREARCLRDVGYCSTSP
jgi:hypothetical protein